MEQTDFVPADMPLMKEDREERVTILIAIWPLQNAC
jgi:hypothetical protein